jgi:hypothetical protein
VLRLGRGGPGRGGGSAYPGHHAALRRDGPSHRDTCSSVIIMMFKLQFNRELRLASLARAASLSHWQSVARSESLRLAAPWQRLGSEPPSSAVVKPAHWAQAGLVAVLYHCGNLIVSAGFNLPTVTFRLAGGTPGRT